MTILLALGMFNIIFLRCRELDSIAAVYVGMNFVRANFLLSAVSYAGRQSFYYCCPLFNISSPSLPTYPVSAVYPEISKFRFIVHYGVSFAIIGFYLANILTVYTVLYDSRLISIASTVVQTIQIIAVIISFSLWVRKIAEKQRATFIHFDKLTTDEYATFSYILPMILNAIAQFVYPFSFGEISWQSRSSGALLTHMAIIYTLHMTIIRK